MSNSYFDINEEALVKTTSLVHEAFQHTRDQRLRGRNKSDFPKLIVLDIKEKEDRDRFQIGLYSHLKNFSNGWRINSTLTQDIIAVWETHIIQYAANIVVCTLEVADAQASYSGVPVPWQSVCLGGYTDSLFGFPGCSGFGFPVIRIPLFSANAPALTPYELLDSII